MIGHPTLEGTLPKIEQDFCSMGFEDELARKSVVLRKRTRRMMFGTPVTPKRRRLSGGCVTTRRT